MKILILITSFVFSFLNCYASKEDDDRLANDKKQKIAEQMIFQKVTAGFYTPGTFLDNVVMFAFVNLRQYDSKAAIIELKKFQSQNFKYIFVANNTLQDITSFLSVNPTFSKDEFAMPIPGKDFKKLLNMSGDKDGSLPFFLILDLDGILCDTFAIEVVPEILTKKIENCRKKAEMPKKVFTVPEPNPEKQKMPDELIEDKFKTSPEQRRNSKGKATEYFIDTTKI